MRVTWFSAKMPEQMTSCSSHRGLQIPFFTPNFPFQGEVLQLLYQKVLPSPHVFTFLGFSQFGLRCHYLAQSWPSQPKHQHKPRCCFPWRNEGHSCQPPETARSAISACWNPTHPLRFISQALSSWAIPTGYELFNPCTPGCLVCSFMCLTSFWLAFSY